MWKTLVTVTAALAISGLPFANAQPSPGDRFASWRPSAEDIAALTDARIAALKAGLKLTPTQERYWPAVELAIRELAKERIERKSALRREEAVDPVQQLRRRADAMAGIAAAVKKLADSAEPLYLSLDDAQKRRLSVLMPHAGMDRMAILWRLRQVWADSPR
jgi:zinc resistance-associated protein